MGNSGLKIFGYILIGLALLFVFYAGVAFIAINDGNNARKENAIQELNDQAKQQLELVRQDLLAGNYDLAERRLQFVLEVDPSHVEARELLLTIPNAVLPTVVAVSPTEAIEINTTPETVESLATPSPTATIRPIGNASTRLQEIETLIEAAQWDETVNALVAFQLDFPGYERPATDLMLFDAYIEAGYFHTNRSGIAIGITYFEQAQKLGTLPEQAAGQLRYAKMYQDAVAYYGVNWAVSIQNFQQICTYAPFYQDSCDQLYEAYVAYGDAFYNSKDFCSAAIQYSQALTLQSSSRIRDRYNSANGACQTPTATPQWWEITPTP